jgi:hypothetical protein
MNLNSYKIKKFFVEKQGEIYYTVTIQTPFAKDEGYRSVADAVTFRRTDRWQ